MSFQSFVTERLAAITNSLNAISTNAKKIDELPAQTILDPASKIHVSKAGTSQSLEIQKIINAISEGNYSQLLSVGEISVTGLVISVPSGAQWVYENVNYATVAVTNITETLCATGFLRKDILVANQSNQIVLVKGTESETIRIRPNIPLGTILVTEIDVDDSTIGDTTTPIIGNPSYTKLETDSLLKIDTGVESSITTVDFGGIPAGTDIQDLTFNSILIDAMIAYLYPQFTAKACNYPSLVEVGTMVSGIYTFTWAISNGTNIVPNSVNIFDLNANDYLVTGLDNDGSEAVALNGNTLNTNNATQVWQISAENTKSEVVESGNITTTAIYPIFYGKTNSQPTANQALIDGGTKAIVSSTGTLNITFGASGQYLWFAHPALNPTKTKWYVNALNNGNIGSISDLFNAPTTVSITTVMWAGVSYKIYISNIPTTTSGNMELKNS